MKKRIVKYAKDMSAVETVEGEIIEKKIQRIMDEKSPIDDSAPIIYTEKKNGINPAHDVRTDRFDLALEAMEIETKKRIAANEENFKDVPDKLEGGTPSEN
jgi:hypothetical protein